MQRIADWLNTLGLSEYAQRFSENDIDFAIVGDLTDQDLEKIGVASLGHRRKLLRAIAELKGAPEPGPGVATAGAPHDTAERRQVTVMFSDLVGSTALSARMDPEDLREVISAYQKCVAGLVQVASTASSRSTWAMGVLVYFGYPQAHEDDAERAVRAGLELVAAVSDLKTHATLQTRVGIATGLVVVGDLIGSGSLTHYNQAIALYDPAEHRSLATRFGQDHRVSVLYLRSVALWVMGYPEAALKDAEHALKDAREIGQAVTLMYALVHAPMTHFHRGNYAAANAQLDEVVALAVEKGAFFWKALGIVPQGCVLALAGKASDAIQTLTSGVTALRSTGSTLWLPLCFSYLAMAYAQLGQFNEACRSIGDAMTAMETTMEKWFEADILRMAGEIALISPERDVTKAEAYFDHALTVARQQQAKSWELRAAMSLARLWRSQGKPQQARELLAPVYGWFTEGFDTRDLKEAKMLLEELAA